MAGNAKAIKFYKNRGFSTSKFHDGYYRIDSVYHDAYEMTLTIPTSVATGDEAAVRRLMVPTNSELQIELIAKDKATGSLITVIFIVLAVLFALPILLFFFRSL